MTNLKECKSLFLRFLVLYVLSWSASITAKASFPEVKFRTISTIDGLNLGNTTSFHQDSRGFIWFTAGTILYRYDAYGLKRYMHSPSQTTTLNGTLSAIAEDASGTMWVTSSLGLYRYNIKQDNFTQFVNTPGSSREPVNNRFRDIAITENQTLLLATAGGGLYAFNPKTESYKSVPLDYNNISTNKNIKKSAYVLRLSVDKNNAIWVGTKAGLYTLNPDFTPVNFYSTASEKSHRIVANLINTLAHDKRGNTWVGTNKGLNKIDSNGEVISTITHETHPEILQSKIIWDILADKNDDIWLATDGSGIVLHLSDENKSHRYTYSQLDPQSIGSNVVHGLFEDAQGDIWAGLYPGGISVFHRNAENIKQFKHDAKKPQGLNHPSVLAVLESRDKTLWLGTDGGGLNHYDPKTGLMTHYVQQAQENSLCANAVLALEEDSQGHIWIGTWGGSLCRFNRDTQKFTHYPYIEGDVHSPCNANVWGIREGLDGKLWLNTQGGGVCFYDPDKNHFQRIPYNGISQKGIQQSNIWATFIDKDGYIWMDAGTGGISRLDPSNLNFKHFLPQGEQGNIQDVKIVISFYKDTNERLWLGTRNGLVRFNEATSQFTYMSHSLGLSNISINFIQGDGRSGLWLGTSDGLFFYDSRLDRIKKYNDQYWGKGKFNQNAAMMSDDGHFYFGSVNGVTYFKPSDLKKNERIPPVEFTDFKIFNQRPIIGAKDSSLQQSLQTSKRISLDHTQSMFSFEFAALNYFSSNNNQYKYRLLGFDKRWNKIGNERKAVYTNLNAGDYNLEVKASNNEGLWNEKGKHIGITILPPPWKTWWAYSLYALITLYLLGSFIRRQYQKRMFVEAQNRLLESKVAERTKSLSEKNDNIQSMLSNMQQGLFTITEDGKIHHEYSDYLETIFETTAITGRDAIEFLFSEAILHTDQRAQITQTIDSIVGGDIINFQFNLHLLPTEFDTQIHSRQKNDNEKTTQKKHLELNWNPIIENNTVTKLMVTVRDRTQLRQLEFEAKEQKRELEIIGQILKIDRSVFHKFIGESLAQLKKIESAIRSQILQKDTLDLLFREIHTLKGNARTFSFQAICDITHDAESYFTSLVSHPTPEKCLILDRLAQIETCLLEYQTINNTIRGELSPSNEIRLNTEVFELTHQALPLPEQTIVTNFLDTVQAKSLSRCLANILATLPSIALALNKESPNVLIDDQGIKLKASSEEFICNTFTHLIRNSLDHGIESPEVRQQANKKASGTIEIGLTANTQSVEICIKDDGQGLNINALREKGQQAGYWQGSSPSVQEVALLIFESGLSTKEQLSDISGRGVGMDAIKVFINEQGGEISLQLFEHLQDADGFTPFETLVKLPAKLFIKT